MPTSYPSDLNDFEWKVIAPLIPKYKKGGRKRSVDMRRVVNAIFYILKAGCQWNMLPKDFPPKSTVHEYFSAWKKDGTIDHMHRKLRKITRVIADRKPDETAGIIDSQSVKTAEEADQKGVGVDMGKKNTGKKKTYIGRYTGTLK